MRRLRDSSALVEAWLDLLPAAAAGTVREVRRLLLEAEPDLVAGIGWGNLVFRLDGAPLLALVVHKAHVSLQVFNGAVLSGLPLQGSGRQLRHLKLRQDQPLDAELLRRVLRASVAARRAA